VIEAVFRDRPRPAQVDPVRMLVREGRIMDTVAMLRIRDGIDLTTASARIDELRNAPDSRPSIDDRRLRSITPFPNCASSDRTWHRMESGDDILDSFRK
jgi:hypothetical protein